MKKLSPYLVVLFAVIQTAQVKNIDMHHGSYIGVCAYFDILDGNAVIGHFYQCGPSEENVVDGIKAQLVQKANELDDESQEKARIERLSGLAGRLVGRKIQEK